MSSENPNLPQVPHGAPPSEDRPSAETLAKAGEISIYDKDGKELKFKSLYEKKSEDDNEVNMVIFIRHFFCGLCQDYITALSESIKPEDLTSHTPKINLHIIGCGAHNLIKNYAETTKCPFGIYSEPTQALHNTLGLAKTMQRGEKSKYEKQGLFGYVSKSVVQALTWGGAFKGGDIHQVGGEFMWIGGECVWCFRMKSVRDHTEVDVLRKVIGLDQQ